LIYDGHLHLIPKGLDSQDEFVRKMKVNGVLGGLVISLPPQTYNGMPHPLTDDERLKSLMEWVDCDLELFPFYWLDPLAKDAKKQIDKAAEAGVRGFKIICNRFYPGNDRAMRIYESITESGKPILFHSGILFDGDVSGKFSKPLEFEVLLEIKGIRFALAHVGWPWYDEYISLYGKFQAAYDRNPNRQGEMFIDLTPGAPGVYREEIFKKLFGIGYNGTMDNVFFGTDCKVNRYRLDYSGDIIKRDLNLFNTMGFSEQEKENILVKNIKRFVKA